MKVKVKYMEFETSTDADLEKVVKLLKNGKDTEFSSTSAPEVKTPTPTETNPNLSTKEQKIVEFCAKEQDGQRLKIGAYDRLSKILNCTAEEAKNEVVKLRYRGVISKPRLEGGPSQSPSQEPVGKQQPIYSAPHLALGKRLKIEEYVNKLSEVINRSSVRLTKEQARKLIGADDKVNMSYLIDKCRKKGKVPNGTKFKKDYSSSRGEAYVEKMRERGKYAMSRAKQLVKEFQYSFPKAMEVAHAEWSRKHGISTSSAKIPETKHYTEFADMLNFLVKGALDSINLNHVRAINPSQDWDSFCSWVLAKGKQITGAPGKFIITTTSISYRK